MDVPISSSEDSQPRTLFEATQAELSFRGKVYTLSAWKLHLQSRVAAVGDAGKIATQLLLGDLKPSSGDITQHDYSILELNPQHLADRFVGQDYTRAIKSALEARPQVLIISECIEEKNNDWTKAFDALLQSEDIRSFGGALVVCVADETRALAPLCIENWVSSGTRLQQGPFLEVIEDALIVKEAEELLNEALAIDYCRLDHWIEDARETHKQVTVFAVKDETGRKQLVGFVCHHMIASNGEFHIRFIFVPRPYRKGGFGGRLVRWCIARASRMPQSRCRWVSLDAADDTLVSWYETFGFFDMTCGHDDDDDAQTWMEMQNVSIVDEDASPAVVRKKSSRISIVVDDECEKPSSRKLSRKGSARLAILVDESGGEDDTPTMRRTATARLALVVDEESDREVPVRKPRRKITIPRELWNCVSEQV